MKKKYKVLLGVFAGLFVLIFGVACCVIAISDCPVEKNYFDGAVNPYIADGTAMVSAHRAGSIVAPENTLNAFMLGIEEAKTGGYTVDIWEFDLHITKDNRLVLLLAGIIIFPAAFAVGIQPDSGPGLLFVTLPNVFQQAFGNVPFIAALLAVMFYILLALAALTSTISLHEVVTAYLHEEFNLSRGKAARLVTAGCIVLGALCSLSLGLGREYTLFGMTLFDLFDFVTAKLMLPLGGFFIALFTGWFLDKKIVWEELTNRGTLRVRIYRLILFLLKFVAPIGIAFVFINELKLL